MTIYEPDSAVRVAAAYQRLREGIAVARRRLGRPLTLTEKILFGHMAKAEQPAIARGKDQVPLLPDRVALQDATAQMALLQFELAGLQRTRVPATVHCDHLIRAQVGADADLKLALNENEEVYRFLQTASARYGIGFWKPGSGIIHQVVFENYAFPGGLMIGTDSHTPNAGGMGMVAIGVGGADAVDVMAGLPWGVTMPKIIGVYLTGRLDGWNAPKDVILQVAGELTVKGGTGAIIEYFGPGMASISATGRGTITNMGAEIGATTSVFPYDERTACYLRATDRGDLADLADAQAADLRPDPEVEAQRAQIFDRVIEINLSELEPGWVGPHTPDLHRGVSAMREVVEREGYPAQIKDALIGSCTNSSYEDMSRAASVAQQAAAAGLKVRVPLLVTPGSEQIRATAERDGQLAAFEAVGGMVLANACGPCIGQWKRSNVQSGEPNTIVTSFNRNFPARNDGNSSTLAFIGSPELVVAAAFAGDLRFDPRRDSLPTPDGQEFRFQPPVGEELPARGFEAGESGYVGPPTDGSGVEVVVTANSERLQRLEPFPAWDGKDFENLAVLLKAKGKCTTDHISPAGPWLRYRGHLDRISDNLFIGANNVFGGAGTGVNVLSSEENVSLPKIARAYKEAGVEWVAIGDENYGEGSSREHAAMEPRFLGGRAVIARSFARIHETNLKKQGVLALTFDNPGDYERIRADDRLSIVGLGELAPGQPVEAAIRHGDGSMERIRVRHSMTPEEIAYFRAGSALNLIAAGARR